MDERIYLLAIEYLLNTVSVLTVSRTWSDHYDDIGDQTGLGHMTGF